MSKGQTERRIPGRAEGERETPMRGRLRGVEREVGLTQSGACAHPLWDLNSQTIRS